MIFEFEFFSYKFFKANSVVVNSNIRIKTARSGTKRKVNKGLEAGYKAAQGN